MSLEWEFTFVVRMGVSANPGISCRTAPHAAAGGAAFRSISGRGQSRPETAWAAAVRRNRGSIRLGFAQAEGREIELPIGFERQGVGSLDALLLLHRLVGKPQKAFGGFVG